MTNHALATVAAVHGEYDILFEMIAPDCLASHTRGARVVRTAVGVAYRAGRTDVDILLHAMPEQHLPDALYAKAKVAFSEQDLESLVDIANEMVRHDSRAWQTDAAFADVARLLTSQGRRPSGWPSGCAMRAF